MIPEKLYGRAREIDILLASFGRVVRSGRSELVLISGYSGIGKSSVINELHKALVPLRGLFASGKFDQFKRDIPYSTLAQAFQSLIRPLLVKGEAELDKWRAAFREALGPNGRLIGDLARFLHHVMVGAKGRYVWSRWQSALSKSGLNDAAEAASGDTAGLPPLFFWCRGQHREASAREALQAGAKELLEGKARAQP